MKVLQINSMYIEGSTGNICYQIEKEILRQNKGYSRTIYFYGKRINNHYAKKIGNLFYEKYIALVSRITGKYGLLSHRMSEKLIHEIEEYRPDIIHLHNIHDHTVDISILFSYLKKINIPIIWTFHDCWPFTGYCSHYTQYKCKNWYDHCGNCPIYKKYSWFFDKSQLLIETKKYLYKDINFNIIVPSKWLFEEVSKSFLYKNYKSIIYNGIDLGIFYPRNKNLKKIYNLQDKYIILGVAYKWDNNKGLDIFIELSKRLPSSYTILLVGEINDKNYHFNNNTILINKINNQEKLAEIYSLADVFVNPTKEEVLGLVNIESLACGTPVITNNTGGSPECIDLNCGVVIDTNNINKLIETIKYVCKNKPFSIDACINRAKSFDSKKIYDQYIKEYEDVLIKNHI